MITIMLSICSFIWLLAAKNFGIYIFLFLGVSGLNLSNLVVAKGEVSFNWQINRTGCDLHWKLCIRCSQRTHLYFYPFFRANRRLYRGVHHRYRELPEDFLYVLRRVFYHSLNISEVKMRLVLISMSFTELHCGSRITNEDRIRRQSQITTTQCDDGNANKN